MVDVHTGFHHLDENGATVHRAAGLARPPAAGRTEIWWTLPGAAREVSWTSTAGNGVRRDPAVVSADLAGRVAARFDHTTGPNPAGHSALVVDLRGDRSALAPKGGWVRPGSGRVHAPSLGDGG